MSKMIIATDEFGIKSDPSEFFGPAWKWCGKDVRKFMAKHPGEHIKITVSNTKSFVEFTIGEEGDEAMAATAADMVAAKALGNIDD